MKIEKNETKVPHQENRRIGAFNTKRHAINQFKLRYRLSRVYQHRKANDKAAIIARTPVSINCANNSLLRDDVSLIC